MTMTDPIGDLIARIRNAYDRKHDKVVVPASRIKANIVRVLKEEGFVKNFRLIRDEQGHLQIKVQLKYVDGESAIRGIRRVSTPGLRQYTGHSEIARPAVRGAGVPILSTSKGIMTGRQARQQRVGGELLCEVW